VTYERNQNALIVKINTKNGHEPDKPTRPIVVSAVGLVFAPEAKLPLGLAGGDPALECCGRAT